MSKLLCFTVSYERPYNLYCTINNVLNNQSYKDFDYSVRVNIDNSKEIDQYKLLLNDFLDDKRLNIFFANNESQQTNYITAITNSYKDHDIFAKIDDDDIYHKKYLETGVDLFTKSDADIISFNSFIHINNKKIFGQMNSIGVWNGDKNQKINFGMPPTYFFNKKALDLIKDITDKEVKSVHLFEDAAWRTKWRQNNLKSIIYDNKIFTYNVHGQNVSSKFLYDRQQQEKTYLENKYFALYEFRHKDWQSYVYLNKRNNRVYNIANDDHGSYEIIDSEKIQITWDEWGVETFIKLNSKNYYEKYN